jgi:hypothetical protein
LLSILTAVRKFDPGVCQCGEPYSRVSVMDYRWTIDVELLKTYVHAFDGCLTGFDSVFKNIRWLFVRAKKKLDIGVADHCTRCVEMGVISRFQIVRR